MQARGFLNYRLKYCWSDIYCICQTNELKREIKKKNWWGKKQGANQKPGGVMAHPGLPLVSPLVSLSDSSISVLFFLTIISFIFR